MKVVSTFSPPLSKLILSTFRHLGKYSTSLFFPSCSEILDDLNASQSPGLGKITEQNTESVYLVLLRLCLTIYKV